MNISEELKKIEKEQKRLAKQRVELEKQAKAESALELRVEAVYQKSGFPTPRALIIALMKKYGVNVAQLRVETPKRRKRTKVTAAFRDGVKAAIADGKRKTVVCRDFEVSYIVVAKILNGEYDAL